MKVLTVPKGKCPLDFLAEQGDRIKNGWLFIDDDVFNELSTRNEKCELLPDLAIVFKWKATDEYPVTEIKIVNSVFGLAITEIKASDISFKSMSKSPEEVFFLEMDK